MPVKTLLVRGRPEFPVTPLLRSTGMRRSVVARSGWLCEHATLLVFSLPDQPVVDVLCTAARDCWQHKVRSTASIHRTDQGH